MNLLVERNERLFPVASLYIAAVSPCLFTFFVNHLLQAGVNTREDTTVLFSSLETPIFAFDKYKKHLKNNVSNNASFRESIRFGLVFVEHFNT